MKKYVGCCILARSEHTAAGYYISYSFSIPTTYKAVASWIVMIVHALFREDSYHCILKHI